MTVQRQPPVYHHPPEKTSSEPGSGRHLTRTLGELYDGVLFWVAAVATVMLAVVLFQGGLQLSLWAILYFLLLWAVSAYLALPRLHLALSSIYVPHYFIARTRTGDGLLGDPVNLALDGDEAQIHEAMRRAGWVMADPINLRSSLRIVLGSVLRRSYPEAPVSSLYLFERKQDFAYQMEVEGNPAQRHHVRFWECPEGWLLPGGAKVGWLAAGTYDRSVGFSLFTLQITHKIDADIDIERDFIVDSVLYASPEAGLKVLENFSTGYHSRNGGGDLVRTDGNLPVLQVQAVTPDDGAIVAAKDTLDPYDVAPDDIGKRPTAVVIGVLLMLVIFITDTVNVVLNIGQVQGVIEAEGAEALEQQIMIFVWGTVVLLEGLSLLGAWMTYLGRAWGRRLVTTLIGINVLIALQELIVGSTQTNFAWQMISTALAVLTLYALTSQSAKDWVVTKKKHDTHVLHEKKA